MNNLTNPNWPEGLENNKIADPRNVIDHYKYWKTEAIKAELDKNRSQLQVAIENLSNDFNIGTVIRNANAFATGDVHYVGRKKWNRLGAVGTHNYTTLVHHESPEVLYKRLKEKGFRLVVVDNIDGAISLPEYQWEEKSVIVFGQEQIGVSPSALALADDVVYIPQLGSTRSLNVGVASGIIMYDYNMKIGRYTD